MRRRKQQNVHQELPTTLNCFCRVFGNVQERLGCGPRSREQGKRSQLSPSQSSLTQAYCVANGQTEKSHQVAACRGHGCKNPERPAHWQCPWSKEIVSTQQQGNRDKRCPAKKARIRSARWSLRDDQQSDDRYNIGRQSNCLRGVPVDNSADLCNGPQE